jgi:predicted metal-binding protein
MAHVVGAKPQALVGGVQPASSKSVPHQQHRSATQCQAAQRPVEVSICTNKTCKKQGSKQVSAVMQHSCGTMTASIWHEPPPGSSWLNPALSVQILQFVQDLHLDNVTVQETGCLANCGSGPNVAVSPPDVVLNHMGTVARFSEALRTVCGADVSPDVLRATELRLAGNAQVSTMLAAPVASVSAMKKVLPDVATSMLHALTCS